MTMFAFRITKIIIVVSHKKFSNFSLSKTICVMFEIFVILKFVIFVLDNHREV